MTTDTAVRDIPATVRALRDTQQVVDAVYRFGAGQDLRDPTLFLSAFAPDAVLDLTHPARRFGADVPVMHGRDAIATILTTLEPLATTHAVTNPRVVLHGDRARLWALVEAQQRVVRRRRIPPVRTSASSAVSDRHPGPHDASHAQCRWT